MLKILKIKKRSTLVLILLLLGLVTTLLLLRQRQDIRQRANYNPSPCESYGEDSLACRDYINYMFSEEYLMNERARQAEQDLMNERARQGELPPPPGPFWEYFDFSFFNFFD